MKTEKIYEMEERYNEMMEELNNDTYFEFYTYGRPVKERRYNELYDEYDIKNEPYYN